MTSEEVKVVYITAGSYSYAFKGNIWFFDYYAPVNIFLRHRKGFGHH